jgi:hypothetical protein
MMVWWWWWRHGGKNETMVAKIALATCAKDGRSLALTLGGKGRRMEDAPPKKDKRQKRTEKGLS